MKKSQFDWLSVFFAISASIIGIVVLYGGGGIGETQAIKKIIWLFLGLIVMFTLRFVNYQIYGSYSFIFYLISIILLVLTLVPFIGTKVKGARSWIRFFDIGFQPTELAKLAFVFFLSKYLTIKDRNISGFQELIVPFTITAIPMILIALQPDLGYAIMFLPLLFLMLFIGGANLLLLFSLAFIGFSIFFLPMYIEYHKFIMVDDIYTYLRDSRFQLADAVRILNFDVWQYVERPELAQGTTSKDSLFNWAVKTVTQKENIIAFKKASIEVMKMDPNFLRDFLNNTLNMVYVIIFFFIVYLLSILFLFLTSKKWIKPLVNMSLILFIGLGSSLLLKNFFYFKPHQVIRIVSFANPENFPKGAGYQLRHSLIAMGSGKINGKGIFQGDMTRGDVPFLPEWHNDFIFSVIGEQLGFVGASLALFFLLAIIIRGTIISLQSKDNFGALLASGITIIFFLHIFINIGITVGFFPVTGIPLPFISSGGSNMISSFIGLGILLNINARRFINV